MTVSNLPATRQPHSVLAVFVPGLSCSEMFLLISEIQACVLIKVFFKNVYFKVLMLMKISFHLYLNLINRLWMLHEAQTPSCTLVCQIDVPARQFIFQILASRKIARMPLTASWCCRHMCRSKTAGTLY